jgi:hypothetical protein
VRVTTSRMWRMLVLAALVAEAAMDVVVDVDVDDGAVTLFEHLAQPVACTCACVGAWALDWARAWACDLVGGDLNSA